MTEFVGQRVPKLDALDKITGHCTYIHDLVLPGMLYAKILRSHVPHAKILNIDISQAAKVPGVKAIITAKDTPCLKFGYGRDRLPLQDEKVRCIGDELAAVAAVDIETAQEALSLIHVDLEELPGIFDPNDALKADAPLIHPENKSNLFRTYNYSHGDVKKGFETADAIVEGQYKLPYQAHCCLGTSGIVAQWDVQGKLTLYDPTQVPFLLKRDIASALGIEPDNVRIIQPTIGGAFGSKLDLYPFELICAILAKKTDRPVKILFDRREEFLMDPLRPKTFITMKTGATKDGKLIASQAEVIIDCGAYVSWGAVTPVVMMHTYGCLYNIPNVEYKADVVYTNNPHVGAMRGFGNPELMFALEAQVDQLANELSIDPLQMRLINANKAGEVTRQGSKIISCGFSECLKKAAQKINWEKRKDENWRNPEPDIKRGIGLASCFHVGGGARIYRSDGCGAIAKIDDFGVLTLIVGATDIGQGAETVLAQIAAEELSIPLKKINIVRSDTEICLWDVGVHASRTTFIAGNAVRLACQQLKDDLFKIAAQMIGKASDDLYLKDGIICSRSDSAKNMPLDKLTRSWHFREQGSVLVSKAFYDPPTSMADDKYKGNISATYTFGAQVAEVEVDMQTGQINVLKIVAAHDVGKAINPMYVEGQIEGGVVMGLGYALTEEALIEKGRHMNPNFIDYRIPGPRDCPKIDVEIIETDDPLGPYGAKGVGEPGTIPTAAAVRNAVADAIGIYLVELPMTPERLLKAIKS